MRSLDFNWLIIIILFRFFFTQTVDKMDEFGITSFGVSVTTLEEVFMKVGEGAEKTVDDLYV